MKYVVVETQTNKDGTVANLTFPFDTQNEAESKYHDVLHYAAVSTLPVHGAILFTNTMRPIMYYAYEHDEEPTNE